MTYLTSEDFVKSFLNISDNLSDKFLSTAIREAQDIEYQQTVGTAMYRKLIQLVDSEDIETEEYQAYKDLLDNSQYFIAYCAVAKVCLLVSSKVSNVGVYSSNDENVQSYSLKDALRIQEEYIHKSDDYKKMLQDYCREHKSDLPELCECSLYGEHSNLYSSASSPIWLGGPRGKGTRCTRPRRCND